MRVLYPRAFKSSYDQRIKLQEEINREFQAQTEARFLAIGFLGKRGVFWLQLAAEIEAFHMHMVTTTYGGIAPQARKLE